MLRGGICTARREKTGSLTLLLVQTQSSLQGWSMKVPPWRISSVGSGGTIFFSALIEAVILLAAKEKAAGAITTSLGSANKRHKSLGTSRMDQLSFSEHFYSCKTFTQDPTNGVISSVWHSFLLWYFLSLHYLIKTYHVTINKSHFTNFFYF